MRTKVGALVALVGAVLLAFGIARVVSDGAHTNVAATLKPAQAGYVVTDPGVLDLVNLKVHVEAKAADASVPVTVAVGASDDVAAWADGLPVAHVTGLDTWETLSSTTSEATVEETPAVSGSDMWTHVESGEGTVAFDYTVEAPGATSIIARSGDEGATPELTLSWQRPDSGGAGLPLSVVGVLILAIGAVLLAMGRKDSDGIGALFRKLKGTDMEAIPAVEAAAKARAEEAKAAGAEVKQAADKAAEAVKDAAEQTTQVRSDAVVFTDEASQAATDKAPRISLFAKDKKKPFGATDGKEDAQ